MFFGDKIEESGTYDPTSQRSINAISKLKLLPMQPKWEVGEEFKLSSDEVQWVINEPQHDI